MPIKYSLITLFISLLFNSNVIAATKIEIDEQRIKNTHQIADIIEFYKEKMGYYPLENYLQNDGKSIQVKIGHPPITNSSFIKLSAPHIKEVHFSTFEKELKKVLGEQLIIPLDPVEVDFKARNFSIYAIYPSQYFLSCHLNFNHKYARKLGKKYYKYELTNIENPGKNAIYYKGLSIEEKEKILTIIPDVKLHLWEKAFAYYQNNNYKKAIKFYKKSLKKEGGSFETFSNLAYSYSKMGKQAESIEYYTKAINIGASNEAISTTYLNRAYVYLNQKNYDLAISDANLAVNSNPNNVKGYRLLAFLYIDKNEPDKAIKAFDNVLKLNPNDVDGRINRGVFYLKKGIIDKASLDFDKALELDSKEFNVRLSVSSYYAMYDQKDLAIKNLELAHKEKKLTPKALESKRFDKIRHLSAFKDIAEKVKETSTK